jgi:Dolichyl-phosphate-mannose-protein mannosyltransferase
MLILLGGAGLLAFAALRIWTRPPAGGSRAAIDLVEAIFLSATTGLIVLGWIAVALASLGWFSLPLVGAGAAAAGGALLLGAGRDRPIRLAPAGRSELALVALLAISAGVYARPHEYVLGGVDAGTYVNVAATIARTGSLVVHDGWVALLADHGDVSLRPSPRHLLTRHIQFVGWYVDDDDPSRVLPQFLPFHPALTAIAIAVGGLRAGLYVPPLCALLGLAGVFLVARRLFGPGVALLAAVVLGATPTQVFFARYPTAEPLSLALVFAGLLAYQHLRDGERGSIALGLVGGAAFGAAALTRIDLLPVLAMIAVALVLEWRAGAWGRGWSAFTAALVALLIHLGAHGRLLAWPYVWNVFEGPVRAAAAIARRGRVAFAVAAFAAVAACAAAAWLRLRRGRPGVPAADLDAATPVGAQPAAAPTASSEQWIRNALAAGVVLASLYAYFLRPQLEGRGTATTWPSGLAYPLLDAETWVRVGWYLTPLGLALATLGLALILRREPLARVGLFTAIGALTTVQYVARIMTTPYHIYAMRRFVPIVLPSLAIFAAVGIGAIAASPRIPRARAFAALVAAALVLGLVVQNRSIAPDRDLAGAIDWVHTLESRLRPGAVILIAEPQSGLFADTFGPPLRYLFDHPVVPLRQARAPTLALLTEVFERAAREDRAVQLLATDPIPLTVRRALAMRPIGTVPVTLSMLMNTYEGRPSQRQVAHYGIEIYDVSPRGPGGDDDGDVFVDIGTLDAPFLRGGFHYKEVLGDGTSGRWTDGDASLDVPRPTRRAVDIAIRARLFAGARSDPPLVRVVFDDRPVGSFRPDDDWQTFRFTAVPRPWQGYSRLRLITEAFTPADETGSPDERKLGVFVDWVRVTER